MQVIINGQLQSAADPGLHITDRGYLLGDALFETLLYDKALIDFDVHYARLSSSAKRLYFPKLPTRSSLLVNCHECLVANDLLDQRSVIRITVSRESHKRGLSIPKDQKLNVMISAQQYDKTRTIKTLCLSTYTINDTSPLTGIKSTNYLENILCQQEAQQAGFDDGIMQNTKGHIAETSLANIFFFDEKGTLLTPPLSSGIVPGIMRQRLINNAHNLGISCIERTILPDEITRFSGCFITNSVLCINLIEKFGSHRFPHKIKPAKITSLLGVFRKNKKKSLEAMILTKEV